MRCLQYGLLATVAVIGFASIASAADMPIKAARAPVAVPFSWSGFYIGANGGYGWSTSSNQLALSDDSPTGLHSKGGFGGGQIGYNFQFSQWVVGVEADFQGASIGDDVNDLNFGDTFHSKLTSFGTVRGRLGFALDRYLAYVTGGFAYGHINNSVSGPFLIGSPYNFSGTATGYVLGGGLEYAIDRAWSIKAEYQYLNLGKNDPTSPAGAPYSNIGGGGFATVNDDAYHTVRLGVNYRFGGGF